MITFQTYYSRKFSEFVDSVRVYTFLTDDPIQMFPEGKFDFIFQHGQKVETRDLYDESWSFRPDCFVGGLHHKSYFIRAERGVKILGVQFKYGAAKHFLNDRLDLFKENIVDLGLIYHKDEFEFLNELEDDLGKWLAGVDHLLEHIFNQRPVNAIDKAISLMSGKMINSRLQTIAAEAGYSVSRFRQRFVEEVGTSPKHFQKILRFQNTLKMLVSDKSIDLLDLSLRNGYYDQSHLIKDFQMITNVAPGEFMNG